MPRQIDTTPEPDNDYQQARDLLEHLFGEMDTGYLLLSTQLRGPDGAPKRWVEAAAVFDLAQENWLDDAVTRVADIEQHHDIYFSVAPRDTDGERLRRAEHTEAITALWADFDKEESSTAKTGQKSWASMKEINEFLWYPGFPEPSAIIDSGNGWHVYWKLEHPLEWGSGHAEQLLARWGMFLSERAAQRNKHLDDVWDPSRVLRLPGTHNWKSGHANPREVRIVEFNPGKVVSESELDDLLPDYDADTEALVRVSHGEHWKILKAQEVHDYLTELGTEETDEDGRKRLEAAKVEMRDSEKGGRHASAYGVLAKLLQDWKSKGVKLNLIEAVEELGQVFADIKPDAERNEWRNMVTHVASRRRAEQELKSKSVVDLSTLRKLTPEEEAERDGLKPWGEPTPISTRETRTADTVPEFPIELLPDVMRGYVEEVATDTQVAADMPAAAALATVSAATAGGFVVNLTTTWDEPLSLYLIVTADPSERKTATLKPFKESLIRAERQWTEQHASARLMHEAEEKALEDAVSNAKKSGDVQAHADALKNLELHKMGASEHIIPDFIHQDVTQEYLATHMAKQNGVGFILSGEGGFIATLAGKYREGGKSDLSFVNDAYSRMSVRQGRVNRGDITVDTPHLVILNFIQPTIAEHLAKPEFQQTGFLSRVLYADPLSQVGGRETKIKRKIIHETRAKQEWDTQVTALFNHGWGRITDPIVLTLELNAIQTFERWWARTEAMAKSDPWWGKAHGQAIRLAGVLTLIEDPYATQITDDAMHSAVGLMRYYASHHASLLSEVVFGAPDEVPTMRRILNALQRRYEDGRLEGTETFTHRDIYKWTRIAKYEAEMMVERLCELGWMQEVKPDRRDSRTFVAHPKLREMGVDTYVDTRGSNVDTRTDVRKGTVESPQGSRHSSNKGSRSVHKNPASVHKVSTQESSTASRENPSSVHKSEETGVREKEDSKEGRNEKHGSGDSAWTLASAEGAKPEEEPGHTNDRSSPEAPASETEIERTLKETLDTTLSDPELVEDMRKYNPEMGDPKPDVPDLEDVEEPIAEEPTAPKRISHTNDCPACGLPRLLIDGEMTCLDCDAEEEE